MTSKLLALGLVALTLGLCSCSSNGGDDFEGDEPGECSDDADNDRDGLFDCDDDGCAGATACEGADGDSDADSDTEAEVDGDTDAIGDADIGSDADGDAFDAGGPCVETYSLLEELGIDRVSHPSPVLAGTRLLVGGEGYVAETECVTLAVLLVGGVDGAPEQEVPLDVGSISNNEIEAFISSASVATFGGTGTFDGVLVVRFDAVVGTARFQVETSISFELVEELTPRITRIVESEVYLNDQVTVLGSGFIGGEEGTTEIVVSGVLTRSDGTTIEARDVRVEAHLVAEEDRTRATFRWTPRIAGIEPGAFVGTITPQNFHAGFGPTTEGTPVEISWSQMDSVLFGIDPGEVSLGQVTDVTGRGFIGSPSSAPDEAEGTTSFRLEGQFWPCTGIPNRCSPEPVPVINEIVGNWESGALVRIPVTVTNAGGYLHSVDFDAPRGRFEGTVTPVLAFGSERRDGIPVRDTTITLDPIRQICWVRFLPDFTGSLALFGIEAVEEEIRSRVLMRLQEIYQPPDRPEDHVNVEFRAEEPVDFYAGGYAILDIGGADPNGIGLIGYDVTPAKDIQNLRLWDHIGGANAIGALDGYGYGGIFIDNTLFWSEHPPLDERPRGSPDVDPAFDWVFDPVRDVTVARGEYPDGAPAERLAEIEEAISALANVIADIAAHEFGHSLGLAQPFVPDGAYHNAVPQEGCLMDEAADRPFEERARLHGSPGARFCAENLWYLRDVLPMD